jgi:hypothetical protein
VIAGILSGDIRAQDDKPRLILGESPQPPATSRERLGLRPNVGQRPLYVFVKNPAPLTKNVTVDLLLNGEPMEGSKVSVSLRPDETQPVKFKFAAPAPAAASPARDAPGRTAAGNETPAAGHELRHGFDKLEIRLMDEDMKEVARVAPAIDVMLPSQYLQVTEAVFLPAGEGRPNLLRIRVKAQREFVGPECKVQLVLSPDNIPGLKQTNAPGSIYQRSLTAAGQEVELVGRDLQFQAAVPSNGVVTLNVDGYDRAFAYETSFPLAGGQVNLRPLTRPMVRVTAPRYAVSGELKFRVETDNLPFDPALKIGVGIDRDGDGSPDDTKTLPGPKDQRIRLSAGKDGALVFQAKVQDWSDVLAVPETYGKYALRAQVIGRPSELSAAQEVMIVADAKPTGIQVKVREKPVRGKPVAVLAECEETTTPIEKVAFFVGKPPADDKVPASVIPARPANETRTVWNAEIPLPSDVKTADVSAVVTNVLGRHAFQTLNVEIAETPPEATTGSIKGKVQDKRGRPQPGCKVVLLDEAKKQKADTKGNDQGEFEFKDLAPGSYTVEATREGTPNAGTTTVKVEKGKAAEIKVEIGR